MNTTVTASPWIICPSPNALAQVRLFCFPYAGGGASVFRTWSKSLPGHVEVCAIQLPGRESRFREPPLTQLPDILGALEQAIVPLLDKPFAFFGHSMGALISFELAHRLYLSYQPVRLFVSACAAPQVPDLKPPFYHLPDEAFVKELHDRYQGIPQAVMEEKELLALLLPVLRADITLENQYRFTAKKRLACPITVFGGLQDKAVSRADLDAWREQTSSTFTLHMLPGDHFFLTNPNNPLLSTIARDLNW